jgi:hypothetical protein
MLNPDVRDVLDGTSIAHSPASSRTALRTPFPSGSAPEGTTS